jgi:hypothetical protein
MPALGHVAPRDFDNADVKVGKLLEQRWGHILGRGSGLGTMSSRHCGRGHTEVTGLT